jgi:hypothetical protein
MSMCHAYRSRWQNWYLSLIWMAFALLGISGLVVGSGLGQRTVGAVLTLGGLVLAIRAYRARVTPFESYIEVRSYYRTRRILWREIDRFEAGRSMSIIPWEVLLIRLADGNTVRVPEISRLAIRHEGDGRVEEIAQDLNNLRQS